MLNFEHFWKCTPEMSLLLRFLNTPLEASNKCSVTVIIGAVPVFRHDDHLRWHIKLIYVWFLSLSCDGGYLVIIDCSAGPISDETLAELSNHSALVWSPKRKFWEENFYGLHPLFVMEPTATASNIQKYLDSLTGLDLCGLMHWPLTWPEITGHWPNNVFLCGPLLLEYPLCGVWVSFV